MGSSARPRAPGGAPRPERDWAIARSCELDGQLLRVYELTGCAATLPTLAFIHGMEEGWEVWAKLGALLAGRVRPLALELPWHGRDGYTWGHRRSAAAWLGEALALLPGPPAVCVAHSFGANALLEQLQLGGAAAPRALVLVSPFYRPAYAAFDWALFEQSLLAFRTILTQGLAVRRGGRLDPELLEAMTAKVYARIGPLGFAEFFGMFTRTPALGLEGLQVPTLVIGARAGDPGSMPAENRALVERLAQGRLLLLDDCAHFSMLEQPQTVAAAVEAFLSEQLAPGGAGSRT